jgi:hypothetical protein
MRRGPVTGRPPGVGRVVLAQAGIGGFFCDVTVTR